MKLPRVRVIKSRERELQPEPAVDEGSFEESPQQKRDAAAKVGQWVEEWRKQKLQDAENKLPAA
jgi:hypothetical protein